MQQISFRNVKISTGQQPENGLHHLLYMLSLTLICLLFTAGPACNKKFDEPPGYSGTQLTANSSIRAIREMHFTGGYEKIFDEYIVEGIVIANDSSDNFYKSIVIQDSTGGITIRMDGNGLHNVYAVGRKVLVRLKELWLGDYAGMVQLGAGVDRSDPNYPELIAIPQPLFGRHILPMGLHYPVIPRVLKMDQLNDSLQSCLVTLADVEMPPADTGRPYADAVNNLSLNRTIRSCSGGSAYLRTSGFARFAAIKTPRGSGSITAVYTVFRTEKQLVIRDTSDVKLNGLRCTGRGPKLLFMEDFETAPTNTDLQYAGWKNISESGGKLFQAKTASNNRYAEISAFATGQPLFISWLILPPVNLANSANEVLSFATRDGFDNGAVLQVYISTNYDGGNTPWKSRWTPLKAAIAKGSVSGISNNWTSSGDISLHNFAGTVHIAFRYEGADPVFAYDKRTTNFQLDNVRIMGN